MRSEASHRQWVTRASIIRAHSAPRLSSGGGDFVAPRMEEASGWDISCDPSVLHGFPKTRRDREEYLTAVIADDTDTVR